LTSNPDLGDKKGVQITAQNIPSGLYNYNFQMNLNCNKDATDITNLVANWDSASSSYVVSFTNKNNCSFDVFSFWNKLGWAQYIIEGVGAVLCIAMCFFGIKMYKPSLGLIGFFAGGLTCYVLLSMFWTADVDQDWYMWTVIGISIVAAILCCVLLICVEKLAFAASGALLGYVIGNFLYDLFLHKMDSGSGVPIVYYVSVILLAVIGAIVSMWLHDHILILALAIGGSYFGVKLIGTMIGNFPEETTIAADIEAGKFDSIPWEVYLYLAIIVVLAIAGIITQCVIRKNSKNGGKRTGDYDGMY